MNKDKYISRLEDIVCDLFDEIRTYSNNYGFNIDDGDCNYNYLKNEFKILYDKYQGSKEKEKK